MRFARWGIVLGPLFVLFACAPSITPRRWEALPEGQRAVMFGTITADISAGAINRYMLPDKAGTPFLRRG